MPIFPVTQLRSPRSCHLLHYREGRGSAESWRRSGGFPGGGGAESRRRACYSSQIWGQFPSRLFFLVPLLLPLKGGLLTNCAACPRRPAPPAGSRAPGVAGRGWAEAGGRGAAVEGSASSWGRREGDGRPLAGCKSRCRTFCPRPHFLPFSSSSWICFLGRRGREGGAEGVPGARSFLPSFLPSFGRKKRSVGSGGKASQSSLEGSGTALSACACRQETFQIWRERFNLLRGSIKSQTTTKSGFGVFIFLFYFIYFFFTSRKRRGGRKKLE